MPVTGAAGFEVGHKIGIGHGATYPTVANAEEGYEVVTVTEVGRPGTQAFLGVDAPAGATNIKVTSVANISVGDKIRLDIDSVGHGIETVTVTSVGTQASRAMLSADAGLGATSITLRARGGLTGFTVGDRMTVGTPANPRGRCKCRLGPPESTSLHRDDSRATVPAVTNALYLLYLISRSS